MTALLCSAGRSSKLNGCLSDPESNHLPSPESTAEDPFLERIKPYFPKPRQPKSNETIEYRHASREDGEAINGLYNKVFQENRSLEHYMWKYWDNPAGSPTGMLAREKATGNCVATGIAQRRIGWVNGHETFGALMCESATDPDMRGGGRLWREVMSGFAIVSVDVDGIPWGYGGQSSEDVIKIGKRWFGYNVILELVTWEIRLSSLALLQRRVGKLGSLFAPVANLFLRARWRKPKFGLQVHEVSKFTADYDELWQRYRDLYRFSFKRDAATLTWRYFDNPAWDHRVVEAREGGKLMGYMVWREWNDSGVKVATVLDVWHGRNKEVLQTLIDACRRKSSAHGCVFLRFAVQTGSTEQETMLEFRSARKSPYVEVDKIIWTPSPGLTPLEQPPQVYEDLCALMDGGADWFYTQGDCDFRD